MTLVALNPSQVRYPWKAVLRTLVQLVITVASIVPWIVSAIDDAADGSAFGSQLTAAGAQALVVASVITRVMALPAVNSALTQWGLGARPADAPAVVLQQGSTIAVETSDPNPAAATSPGADQPALDDSRPYGRHAAQ